jgi:anti-sigma B factor antagonist
VSGQEPFEVQDVVHGRHHTLVLSGELDIPQAAELETMIHELSADGISGITLDLRGLTFMGSTGLRLVLLARDVCAFHRYDFFLIPGSESVQHLFEITGLLTALPFKTAASGEDALEPVRPARASGPR